MKKVAVGLSGGVDSAVSALLLKRAGFDVVGVHLYCWPPKSEYLDRGSSILDDREKEILRKEWIKKNGCRADEDRASALKTALELGISFKELDFSEEYNERVIKYFYKEYEAGRTPNPDVLCNSEIKFGLFLSWALENGFDAIATGHYAGLVDDSKFAESSTHAYLSRDARMDMLRAVSAKTSASYSPKLVIPMDKHKDQTYFLWKLTEKELKHVLFPLGDLLKSEVREIAKEAGLSVADKKDSQGICFVGNVEVREFLKRRLAEKSGEVVNTKREVIGVHRGVAFYTIGERGGWEMNSKAQNQMMEGGETKPLFVIDKDAKLNRLIVGEKKEVMSNKILVESISFINHKESEIVNEKDLFVRIRHGGELVKVEKVELIDIDSGSRSGMTQSTATQQQLKQLDGQTQLGGQVAMTIEREVFGVASGQSAVFYSGTGECLGGGVIV